MSRSNRRTREKRLLRRQQTAQPSASTRADPLDLAPHLARCLCARCRRHQDERTAALVERNERRRKDYAARHPHPEHRAGWNAAGQKTVLADWIKSHRVDMDERLHVTALDLKPSFVAHLDSAVSLDAEDLDPALLYRALIVMQHVHPLRARIVEACTLEGRTRDDVGAQEQMSHQAICKHLDAGLDLLLDIYGGLVLAEQSLCVS